MKIYNTSCFEKLKIRSVDVNKMHFDNIIVKRLDPELIQLQDIKTGYLCRTSEQPTECLSNIWIWADINMLMRLFKTEVFEEDVSYGGLVTPDTENWSGITYLYDEDYRQNYPMSYNNKYNILDIWETSDAFIYDFILIKNADQLIDFFQKYNLRQYENI